MLRLWLFGAIISTTAVNVIYTGNSVCIGECLSTSTSNQYLSHQQCDKYCVCVSGQPQVFHCEFNNHWSQEYEICTHPAEAKCQTWINKTILINALDQGCKTECPKNESAFLAHNDCEKYCLCSNNLVTVLTCSEGHFSVKSNSCVPVEVAGCNINNSRINTARPSIESTTSLIITDNECIGSCPKLEDQSHTVYLAHRNCSKYCHCKKDHPIIKNCRPNFSFSLKDMRCRQQSDVDCDQINSTTTIVIPPSDKAIKKGCQTQCPRYNALIPHKSPPKICLCRDGKVIILECPKSYFFSTDCAKCTDRKSSKLTNPITSPVTKAFFPTTSTKIFSTPLPLSTAGTIEEFNNCMETCPGSDSDYFDVYYNISHKDCNKYCECYKGNITKVVECSAGYNFDRFFRICDSLKYAECYHSNNFISSTMLASTLLTSLSSTTEPLPLSTAGTIEEFNNCMETCPGSDSDYFDVYYNISHKDCNKYCECYKGNITKVVECSAGYNFDRFFQICESSIYADCYHSNYSIASTLSTSLSSTTEPLPPPTARLTEEFNNCVETCPDSDSVYYNAYYNISHKDCNKYCECYKGNIIKIVECSFGYNFDKFLQICESSIYVNCYHYDNFISSTTISSTSSTELPLITQPLDNENECLGNCTQIAFNNYDTVVNLPHKMCNKYCECYRGEIIKVNECPVPYRFDRIHQECIISEDSSCFNNTISITTPSSLSTSLSEDSFIAFSPEFINDDDCVEACPDVDSVNYDEYVKIPHRNCSKYCECYRGIFTVIECPFNSYYDCLFQTCDVLKYAICYDEYVISGTPISPDSSASLPEITENCIGKCSDVNKMNYATFLKHKQRQKFCECFKGQLTVKSCPVNSYFNSNLGLCDQAEYVECLDDNNTSVLSSMTSPDTSDCLGVCVSHDIYLIPHKNCAKYCECDLGYLQVKFCPSGTYFNNFTKRCVDTDYVCTKIPETSIKTLSEYVEGCAEECPYLTDVTQVVSIPHKQCEKYCLCGNWEKPLVMSCGPNSHFNPTRKKCDYIENAGCKGISNINITNDPRIISIPVEACHDCSNKNELHTILLKISGIKNGSEIDLKIGNPDDKIPISNSDDDDMNFGDIDAMMKKNFNEERKFSKDPNGLVTVLATLTEKAHCIGECPQPYLEEFTIYLKHKNCKRACKCTSSGPRVMECHNNYYWNPTTEECDPIIYTGCTEVIDNSEDEPKSGDSLYDKFIKFMGW